MVAVTSGAAVGVDVERVQTLSDLDMLTGTVLAPSERAALDGLADGERTWAFFVTWTRKEALLKATGDGLGLGPGGVVFGPPSGPPRLDRWPSDAPDPGPLRLLDLDAGPGHTASLAVLTESPVTPVLVTPVPT
ncbi:MAG: 4'-phosphopantetheinyl transferase superfamily protein [Streptosporangiales bacterium]|nr:4'-phosphopantetheinyl transferase superfamily protein [Streptosporangiales bacterium]